MIEIVGRVVTHTKHNRLMNKQPNDLVSKGKTWTKKLHKTAPLFWKQV
jgi:hypothetical protein